MVHVESQLEPAPVSAEVIARAANDTLLTQSVAGDLTVVMADVEQLHELNRTYLGIDASTDVLAFPAAESDPDRGMTYLGDVVISVPQARSQAQARGHTLDAEVQLLVVHGVLHLLGFDHADPEGRARMWAAQADVLQSLGLSKIKVPD
jgi:probable rRNA maturation factor